jgi:hypothetical protein
VAPRLGDLGAVRLLPRPAVVHADQFSASAVTKRPRTLA